VLVLGECNVELADKIAMRGDGKRVCSEAFSEVGGQREAQFIERRGGDVQSLPHRFESHWVDGNLPVGGAAKRGMDIVVSLLAIMATLPLMLLIAATIAWNGGSPIFADERVGFGGRRFKALKFRTMRRDADKVLKELLESDPELKDAWLTYGKLRDDPRITPFGHFLRKSSLDELPQFFNVLRGDMSCVGPRPCPPHQIEYYRDYIEDYTAVRPGLTGVWQISGRSDVSMERRVRMDIDYVRSWSLANDILILLRTPIALIRAKGAF
jgi:exopolysaccharide production protein ExoY